MYEGAGTEMRLLLRTTFGATAYSNGQFNSCPPFFPHMVSCITFSALVVVVVAISTSHTTGPHLPFLYKPFSCRVRKTRKETEPCRVGRRTFGRGNKSLTVRMASFFQSHHHVRTDQKSRKKKRKKEEKRKPKALHLQTEKNNGAKTPSLKDLFADLIFST